MSKKTKRNLFNALFLVALLGLTIWAVFKDQDFGVILHTLSQIAPGFLLAGFILVIVYVCSESVIIKYLLSTVQIKVPLFNCIRYSFVGFFYSCITPSATGGQPMQIYFMKKEDIPVPIATVILLVVTITYKFVLVVVGIGLWLFAGGFLAEYVAEARWVFYLGILLNVGCVILMCVVVFHPSFAKKTLIPVSYTHLTLPTT